MPHTTKRYPQMIYAPQVLFEQGHPYLTKENFLSETEREINGSTNPLTERFSVNKCYMFITILEVLTDQTQTKIMTLKYYLTLIKVNNFSNFQKPERPIARTSRNSTRHHFNFENKLNEIYIFRISGHQIPTKVQQTTLAGKATQATIMKSFWKLYPCSLGENNFVGLATALKDK